MDIVKLKEKLQTLSWQEHIYLEADEDDHASLELDIESKINKELLNLGSSTTRSMLDELETSVWGIEWSLRLSVFVSEDDTKARAKRFIDHENTNIRCLANELYLDN